MSKAALGTANADLGLRGEENTRLQTAVSDLNARIMLQQAEILGFRGQRDLTESLKSQVERLEADCQTYLEQIGELKASAHGANNSAVFESMVQQVVARVTTAYQGREAELTVDLTNAREEVEQLNGVIAQVQEELQARADEEAEDDDDENYADDGFHGRLWRRLQR